MGSSTVNFTVLKVKKHFEAKISSFFIPKEIFWLLKIFKWLFQKRLFLVKKNDPILIGLAFSYFKNYQNLLWICWILGKNLPTFVPPNLKLHNQYCHKLRLRICLMKNNLKNLSKMLISVYPLLVLDVEARMIILTDFSELYKVVKVRKS